MNCDEVRALLVEPPCASIVEDRDGGREAGTDAGRDGKREAGRDAAPGVRGSLGAEARAHLQECDGCARFERGLGPLRAALATAIETPPDEVWEGLRARVAPSSMSMPSIVDSGVTPIRAGGHRHGWLRHALSATAAAAAIGFVVWVGPFSTPSGLPTGGATRDPSPIVATAGPAAHEAANPAQSYLAGPGREDEDLRNLRLQVDYLERDMRRF